MKLNKNLVISFLALIILVGCQSVKNTLTLKKDQSVDEFLIEKKNPLVLPPDYSELPVPKKQNDTKRRGGRAKLKQWGMAFQLAKKNKSSCIIICGGGGGGVQNPYYASAQEETLCILLAAS